MMLGVGGGGGALEHELLFPPTDGITACSFAHSSDLLAVSSWDKGVRLYDAMKNQLLAKYEHRAGALDVCFSEDDGQCFSGGVDCALLMHDFKSERTQSLGSHQKAIKCVQFSAVTGQVCTGSWDAKVSLWDPRSSRPLLSSYDQQGKVFSMHLSPAQHSPQRLVVGTSNRLVAIFDLRNMAQPEQMRESSLLHQTRCIRTFPDGTGYALSSVEGRVAIEYFDPDPAVQARKYAFKCHRATSAKGTQVLYPVNAIAFHPIYGTFATGGCDGLINVWDGQLKKRICQYPAYPTSIASLDFNRDGSLLAVAASYTFEEGDKNHPPDAIFIRTVNDHEVRPKVMPTKTA
jgi:cell cycle arrest protein BUB3